MNSDEITRKSPMCPKCYSKLVFLYPSGELGCVNCDQLPMAASGQLRYPARRFEQSSAAEWEAAADWWQAQARALVAGNVYTEVMQERQRQDEKWGVQNHEPMAWLAILMEEVGETSKAALERHFDKTYSRSLQDYRTELVQVAAVAVAMIECYDRMTAPYTVE